MDLQGNHAHEKPGAKEKGKSSKSEGDKAGKSSVQGRETASTIGHVALGPSPPCGACKFLRRKCIAGCIFSPYFGSDQGAARFAAVHKVFGASNVSKLLLHIPAHRRQDAVVTISYEAQARLSDPVYGCISTILALQHQVASLQAELAVVQSQLVNSRLAVASALRNAVQQEQEMSMMHAGPGYSNASSTSNNLISLANDGYPSGFGLADTARTTIGGRGFHPLHLPRPSPDDGEEEDSRNSIVFATSILDRK